MKKFISVLITVIVIQNAPGQKPALNDLYFNNANFQQAKINNEDASKFFTKYHYSSNINGTDGNVFVSFIVRKNGLIDSVQVLNNPGELFKQTALDALTESSGKWNPFRFDNRPFDKKYIAAFNFTNGHVFFYKKDKSLRLLKAGLTTKPLKLIDEALKINPFDIDLLKWRAMIYKKHGDHYHEMLDLLMIEKINIDMIFNIWF